MEMNRGFRGAPGTEMVTLADIVRNQIRIAGEPLGYIQVLDDVGHAIECRINVRTLRLSLRRQVSLRL